MWLPLVVFGAVLAQGPFGPRGMRAPRAGPQSPALDELKAYLNLTDAQIQSLQQARQQAMTGQQTVFTQVRDKHQALRDLLDKGTSDAAAVGKLMLDIRALQKQVASAMTASHTQALSFLTAEQKTKLAALEQAAKLRTAIDQAARLGLLEAPAPGLVGPMGPMRFGPMGSRPGTGLMAPNRTSPRRGLGAPRLG
jgi:Spy/CpxP family protein refolding chaperone